MKLVIAWAVFLAALSFACYYAVQADAVPPAFNQDQEVGTQAGFYESYDEAIAYWAAVPGVRSLEDACGPPPQIFSVVNDPLNFAGYGVPVEGDRPCTIWVETAFISMTDAWPSWARDRARCKLVVHEMGHALGLDHEDYGDPSRVMTPSSTIPEVCKASYPTPPSPASAIDMPRTLCVPGWAYNGPEKALKQYLAGHEAQAFRTFKRWMRKNRKDRARILRFAAVCQWDIYWPIPDGK